MSWDEWFRRRRRHPFFFPFFGEGFFEDFDERMGEMERMMEEMFKDFETDIPNNLVREKRLPDGGVAKEMGPFVYGYSFSVGPDGKPQFREFGNIRPTHKLGTSRPTFDVRGEREPLIDIIPSEDEIRVIAELPGVEKSDIDLNVTEDSMGISVDTPSRKFKKQLELPTSVDPDSTKATYKNGVLEVTLKVKEKKFEGKSVEVE